MKTSRSWTAWYIYYEPPCEGRETIGFFQTEMDADMAKNAFIERNKLNGNNLCCGNSKYVYKEMIKII
jgi:hypothetical protein